MNIKSFLVPATTDRFTFDPTGSTSSIWSWWFCAWNTLGVNEQHKWVHHTGFRIAGCRYDHWEVSSKFSTDEPCLGCEQAQQRIAGGINAKWTICHICGCMWIYKSSAMGKTEMVGAEVFDGRRITVSEYPSGVVPSGAGTFTGVDISENGYCEVNGFYDPQTGEYHIQEISDHSKAEWFCGECKGSK